MGNFIYTFIVLSTTIILVIDAYRHPVLFKGKYTLYLTFELTFLFLFLQLIILIVKILHT